MLHKMTVYRHKKMAVRKKLIEGLHVPCIAMADIINHSAENMNNLSEEESKSDKTQVEVGKEMQDEISFEELQLLRTAAKKYMVFDQLFRILSD